MRLGLGDTHDSGVSVAPETLKDITGDYEQYITAEHEIKMQSYVTTEQLGHQCKASVTTTESEADDNV